RAARAWRARGWVAVRAAADVSAGANARAAGAAVDRGDTGVPLPLSVGSAALQNLDEEPGVDVAAGQDDADPRAARELAAEHRGRAHRAGRLGHHPHAHRQ